MPIDHHSSLLESGCSRQRVADVIVMFLAVYCLVAEPLNATNSWPKPQILVPGLPIGADAAHELCGRLELFRSSPGDAGEIIVDRIFCLFFIEKARAIGTDGNSKKKGESCVYVSKSQNRKKGVSDGKKLKRKHRKTDYVSLCSRQWRWPAHRFFVEFPEEEKLVYLFGAYTSVVSILRRVSRRFWINAGKWPGNWSLSQPEGPWAATC